MKIRTLIGCFVVLTICASTALAEEQRLPLAFGAYATGLGESYFGARIGVFWRNYERHLGLGLAGNGGVASEGINFSGEISAFLVPADYADVGVSAIAWQSSDYHDGHARIVAGAISAELRYGIFALMGQVGPAFVVSRRNEPTSGSSSSTGFYAKLGIGFVLW